MHESEKRKWSRSVVSLLATPWTAAYQAPPSIGFSRQEYGVGYHCLLRQLMWGQFKLRLNWSSCIWSRKVILEVHLDEFKSHVDPDRPSYHMRSVQWVHQQHSQEDKIWTKWDSKINNRWAYSTEWKYLSEEELDVYSRTSWILL